jgi:hypothetical protein
MHETPKTVFAGMDMDMDRDREQRPLAWPYRSTCKPGYEAIH